MTIPSDEAIDRIFGTIVKGHFNPERGFSEEVTTIFILRPTDLEFFVKYKEEIFIYVKVAEDS